MRARPWIFVCVLGLGVGAASMARADDGQEPGHLLVLAGGLGITLSDDRDEPRGQGTGGFVEAEYVFMPGSFFTPRLYGGGLLTFADEDSCGGSPCEVESKILFAGAKARLMAPIPYVGPFFELGVGTSLGYLRTLDLDVDEETSGVALHIPFAIGLALGRRHSHALSFSYLVHPAQGQFAGAFAFGFGIPLP